MMGVVYEAHDPALGRDVALKVIQLAFGVAEEDRQAFEQRFFSEARTAARLSHPGIVVVHDVGRDSSSGAIFMALELLRGRTLESFLKEGTPPDWREALRITQCMAEALHHAHSEGVVHRDIKPANIMLLPSGDPKIMDFGIAKIETSQLTAAGQFLGTPLYMSPEQALAHPVDGRSDLFSLGSVLYEMLTGRQAFAGESVTKILFQLMSREPDPPSLLAPHLPDYVDYLLARCLAKDVARRYPDGQVLAEDIGDILEGLPPRGQETWQALATPTGTMVAASPVITFAPALPATVPDRRPGGAPTTAAAPATQPARPRPAAAAPPRGLPVPSDRSAARSPMTTLAIAGVGATVAVLLVAGVLWLRRPAPEPTPVARRITGAQPSEPARPVQEPPSEPARPAEEPQSELARPSREEVRPPEPTGTPAPLAAIPEPKTTRASDAEANTPARLFIDFEHSLKSGRLRVWVDDQPVIEENLGSRVTAEIAGIRLRKGRLSEALEITPGRREVRVQVAWDDNVKTESAYANFKPGSTRRLKAKLGGLGGLRKDLSLGWQ